MGCTAHDDNILPMNCNGAIKMQNLFDDLKELLKQDDRLMVEDRLLKNRII